MSYAIVSPRAYGGFGASPSAAVQTTLSLLPTKSEVAQDMQPYLDIANAVSPPAGFDPKDPNTWTPERVIPYGIRTVQEITKHLGISPIDLSQATQLVKGELKWLDDLGIPLTTIPTNVRDVAILFVRTSAVAACKQLGIPPEIGTATVDALADGEFTSRDVESIAGVAGGMGASYLCGLIGIPPQLGGYIGSYAGKVVGSLVSDALSIGGGKAEREERERQTRAMRDAVRKQLQAIRGQYQTMVVPLVRTLYWEVFDRMLADLENFWEKTECTTGVEGVLPPVRFPLLWGASGLAQGLSAQDERFLRYGYDASRCPPPNYALTKDAALCVSPRLISPGTASGCPSMFGCPYPSFPELGAGGAERVAQAFAAYNVWWMQPGENRTRNTDAWKAAMPEPPSDIVNFIARRSQERQGCASDRCRQYADRDIAGRISRYNDILGAAVQQAGPNHILEIGMRIQADIISTGAVYASATALRAEKNAIRAGNMSRVGKIMGRIGDPRYVESLQRNVTLSRFYGAALNGTLNFGLPALGAVLLGKAFFGRR